MNQTDKFRCFCKPEYNNKVEWVKSLIRQFKVENKKAFDAYGKDTGPYCDGFWFKNPTPQFESALNNGGVFLQNCPSEGKENTL